MKEYQFLDENSMIPMYHVQDEVELMKRLPNSKPSKRMVKTKKGKRAIQELKNIEENMNYSYYKVLKMLRVEKNEMDQQALFYRGNKITFRQMYEKADALSKSLKAIGLQEGNEIACCLENTPEVAYLILAASKCSIKLNIFGPSFQQDYISDIIDETNHQVVFISDNLYGKIKNIVQDHELKHIVLISLSESLLDDPTISDEYVKELANRYYFDNLVPAYQQKDSRILSYHEFIELGKEYTQEIEDHGTLETPLLVTYTSGSTKVGRPKAMIHANRSLIVQGRFRDPKLCGNADVKGLRAFAHIHTESNTDLITGITDNLMIGWSIALEPTYSKEEIFDNIILNKPNYLNCTTSFYIQMAKEYLSQGKYAGCTLPFMLVPVQVGEGLQKGEERLINKFLRKTRAGSGVSILGFHIPFTCISTGGGDTEHGGIFYTTFKKYTEMLYKPIIGKQELGMFSVPFAVFTALKKVDGQWVECDYNEYGMIVANSATSLKGYKNNPEATNNLFVVDNLGRKWISCNVHGYIDLAGALHMKGRIPTGEEKWFCNFEIDDFITEDYKNILSCQTVSVGEDYVMNIQLQVDTRKSFEVISNEIYYKMALRYPLEVVEHMYIRNIPYTQSFPLTPAGKRSALFLERLGLEDTLKLTNCSKLISSKKVFASAGI